MAEELYALSAQDIGADYLTEAELERACPECGWVHPADIVDPRDIRIRKRRADWGFTCDHRLLVSKHAREVLTEWGVRGITYEPVSQRPSFYAITSSAILAFDAGRRGTRFIDRCGTCGQFAEVIGNLPPFLLPIADTINELTLYRTDLEFGSRHAKGPQFLVGSTLREKLAREFKELHFEKAVIGA